MTRGAVRELAARVVQRYRRASRDEKGRILDDFCTDTGLHRKAAIRLLARQQRPRARPAGRPALYSGAATAALVRVWESADRPCGKLLVGVMAEHVAALERHGELRLSEEVRAELLRMSAATIDRRLRRTRTDGRRQPWRASPSPAGLKAEVPVRTWAEWEGAAPGELQGDLVLHCGETTAGRYLATFVTTDAATGWLGLQPLRSLSPYRVRDGLGLVERGLPVPWRSLHTDNGGEFINHVVVPWCREHGVQLSRGRSYRKNDQARVEQKNWIAVRRRIGYDRYEGEHTYQALRELMPLLELQFNYVRPVRRLVGKERAGSRTRKRYDAPLTPYRRMLAAGLPDDVAARLEAQYLAINPVDLQRRIDRLLTKLSNSRRSGEQQAVG
ncbi:MAG: transposase family protein [Dehalococcoidia bacterium]|nr:transposase family protein [Dehalococcoidia bacterium]